MEELRELIGLMRENGVAELELEREDFRVRLRREATAASEAQMASEQAANPALAKTPPETAPAAAIPHPPTQPQPSSSPQDQDLHTISSPIVGTFYRSPSPSAEAFVKIGTNVEPETVVCIIEAMKLMNEIKAETNGEVVKIYVENGQPVEYGQPLFGIRS
jgi:acetyl-CoA carboxylase biotin carboxyl carrier protein